ncbi:MAG: enoyl-CoA hydratase/isomerase family protein [Candidatus Koribacter versatilis]|uniref:Enoyl-CoA hydratase/isomerase family protein n=1 Tax=Candidatus Korobacter versatilis TaxID=658062 RepID=A0A932A9Y4_9BACT|nr:enoyl-CoA hydratase/isomerase family protein [Candidatus Koribacter versatilis]
MPFNIRKVAVLGAGTMGARIAAHVANAGFPCVLLDIVPPDSAASTDKSVRNKIVTAGFEGARKSKPAAFTHADNAKLITIGNFDDDMKLIADCDWVIEAVAENLEIKRSLLQKVAAHARPDAIVTTNTSGLPVASIVAEMPPEFRKRWFGTHFFNPPRYMRLLEIIPTPDADPAAMAAVIHFGDLWMGKGIVHAKDTPNFIANRIGTYSVLNVMRLMQEMDFSIEEIDALTGTAVGWPKSATFRTIDLVGLDILGSVVSNMKRNVKDERSELQVPAFYQQMLDKKLLGDKTKGGFYKKQKGAEGDERLGIDWKTLEYRPRQKAKFAALEMARNVENTSERLRMLLGGDPAKDKAAAFLWTSLSELWTYAANRIPEISDTVVEIDRAMRMGFNWEMGPFELWDAAGVEATVARMKKEGKPVAANVEKLLAAGNKSWYQDGPGSASGKAYFDLASGNYKPVEVPQGVWSVEVAKKAAGGVVKKNAGCSLVDLGDGVGCLEFHSKMNSLGEDIVQLVTQTLKPGSSLAANFDAFVIHNDAANFSVGANIMGLLLLIQDQEWDDIDFAIRGFQGMTQAIKFSPKPVVAAPFGMALGGGCEISLHAAARNPHIELYMGLVEVGVGLLPGGGGCKEMTLRAVDAATSIRPDGRGESVEMMEAMKKAFEAIAMAKVSTSADEARGLGFVNKADHITFNRDRVLTDAKNFALSFVREGYKPPVMRTDVPAPGENILATLKLGVHLMRQGEFITDYEVKIGNKVAEVICGGSVSPGTPVSEQYLLDLEREGFKSLCGEKKTQERIAYTLKTGKPLRN